MTVPANIPAPMMSTGRKQDTGWIHVGTGAEDSAIGTAAWGADVANIAATDAVYAVTGNLGGNLVTYYLKGTNLGFSVPGGATIDGIEARLLAKAAGDPGTITTVKIVKSDGSIGAVNKAGGEALTTSDVSYEYGGVLDLWGETWAPSDINDVDFGFVLSVTGGAGINNVSVDSFEIKVHYTA